VRLAPLSFRRKGQAEPREAWLARGQLKRGVSLKAENKTLEAEHSLPGPTREEIAVCAYYLYQRRGRQPGHELSDWLQAEEILNPTVRDGTYNELVTAMKEKGANPWEHATRVGTPMTNHSKS
jgi:hypothetical protein